MTESLWQRLYPTEAWPGDQLAAERIVAEVTFLRQGLPPVKSHDEIQRAHDILVFLILNQSVVEQLLDKPDRDGLCRFADVLCWVLGHAHNDSFVVFMKQIEDALLASGSVFRRMPTEQ